MARGFAAVDRFVCISPAMTERMARARVPESAMALIPNGVDTSRFRPVSDTARASIRARLGLSASRWLVTFVGFWSEEKSPDVLFEAWLRAVRSAGIDADLLFVGAAAESHLETDQQLVRRVVARARDEGVADRLHFVERTDDVPAYLQASNVFVLPSKREGLPNALLEAMATGLPCICTDLPGVTDWVTDAGNAGILVAPDDVAALANALTRLYRDATAAAALGRRARTRACDTFAIRSVADQYLSLYEELLRRGSAAQPSIA
jgi:glycosyltransferase involved in cell wall biosynthesis